MRWMPSTSLYASPEATGGLDTLRHGVTECCNLEAKLKLTSMPLFLQIKKKKMRSQAVVYCHFINPVLTLLYSCINTDELKWDRSCQHTAQPDGCVRMSEAYLCFSAQGHLCTTPSIKYSPLGAKSLSSFLDFYFIFHLGNFLFILCEMQSSLKSLGILTLTSKDPNVTI